MQSMLDGDQRMLRMRAPRASRAVVSSWGREQQVGLNACYFCHIIKKNRALAKALLLVTPVVIVKIDSRLVFSSNRGLHVEIRNRWHCVVGFGGNSGRCGPPSTAAGCPDRASW